MNSYEFSHLVKYLQICREIALACLSFHSHSLALPVSDCVLPNLYYCCVPGLSLFALPCWILFADRRPTLRAGLSNGHYGHGPRGPREGKKIILNLANNALVGKRYLQ